MLSYREFRKEIELDKSQWFVYLVRCRDNSLYCGCTNDIDNRIKKHNSGKGAKYINSKRKPVDLVYLSDILSKSESMKMEYRIKRMKKEEKEILCKEWSEKCNFQQ